MASIREVETAIANLIDSTVYPSGHLSPSITGTLVKIGIGYPISVQLDIDLAAGNSQVSVFPVGKSDKNSTRFQTVWKETSINSATLTVTVVGNQITIGGVVSVPQAILISLNYTNYGYQFLIADTTATIAAALAALIPGATVSGSTITLTGAVLSLRASVVVDGNLTKEVKRQDKVFVVSVFSPTPDDREVLGDAIDVLFADNYRIDFPDTFGGLIIYKAVHEMDVGEKNIIYQRDLFYSVEYPTTVHQTGTVIESTVLNLSQ